jgi:hypothetical protein
MGFRRSKSVAEGSRKWRDFLEGNAAQLQASGVPCSLYASREMFDDLLLRGYIDHHDDPTHFFVGGLPPDQREALVKVIVNYLQAGFADPGIGGFCGPLREEVYRKAGIES